MIKVYTAETSALENKNVFDGLYKKVKPVRQEKIDSFCFEKDKRLSLGAGILLKKALIKNGVDYEKAIFSKDENGKPFIKNEPVFFNLSHSKDRVLCVVSDKISGCDIEEITDVNLNIAKKFFSRKETDFIFSSPDNDERKDRFFRIWTLKESFIKAVGKGLKISLDSFSVDISDGIKIEQNIIPENVFFKEYTGFDGYKISICSAEKDFPEIEIVELT